MKKSKVALTSTIQKTKVEDEVIRFSFEHFDSSDEEVCPPTFQPHYTQTLMERLKALSSWKLKEFMNAHSKSIRAHPHDWETTARPQGFQHLNEQLRSCRAWQFQLSKNEHGRVHGFFIGNIFYIVWLDRDHKVYPGIR
jgi:hypothetical protein